MSVTVFGAGAIGGILAARAAAAGDDVAVVARGAHLAAIQTRGLRFISGPAEARVEDFTVHPRATDRPDTLGPQDLVIITLKGHQIPGAAAAIASLCGPRTRVVYAINGIPWWYFHGDTGPLAASGRLPRLDPAGDLARLVGAERSIGCVVYQAAEVTAPGEITYTPGNNRFAIGEPNGALSSDLASLTERWQRHGWQVDPLPRIRDAIWTKLLGNVSYNPISVLTQATMADMGGHRGVLEVVRRVMQECRDVAEALGASIEVNIDQRLYTASKLGAFRTSMLQDFDRNRPLELDGIVAAVSDLGQITGVATPTIDTVLALTSLRAQTAGCLAG